VPEPVLVLGASGKVGSQLCRRLADDGVGVRAFFDPATPTPLSAELPDAVEKIHGDFDDEPALRRACEGAAAVFALTPPSESQPRWQRTMVDAAVAEEVGRIVKLSAFESGQDSPLAMGRWHHEGEVAVAGSGLPYVIIRPQYFMQMQLPALRAAAASGVLRGPAAPDLRIGMIDTADIAAVAGAALTRPDFDGQTLVPTGPSAPSFAEMAAELGAQLGREVRYEQLPRGEVEAELAARGWPEWHIEDYFLIHGDAASDLTTGDVERVAGRPPLAFDAFLRAHAEQLEPASAR
jgi:uncharacterized protein YbjT (DUF2867 family)